VIFTGKPLSIEEEDAARNLDAQVIYKPESYTVLVDHLNRQLQRCSVPARFSATKTRDGRQWHAGCERN
jgi:hypothetical protein